jgi:cathepsin H
MIFQALFSILLALLLVPVAAVSTTLEDWQLLHGKTYATAEEWEYRLSVWNENRQHVQEHNAAYEQGYTLYAKTMNSPFADLTDQEFSDLYLMESQDCSATHTYSGRLRSSSTIKDHPAVDWRTQGILTAVKNQGHCGSCWTFSTSGCLEAHTCLQAGKDCTHWKGLAEEQLVECAGDFNNHGCNGGLPSQAYEYLKYSGGMALEKDYPYEAGNGTCSLSTKTGWRAQVSEVFNITSLDEDDLQHAIATIGPVSIAYQVSPDFRFYSHGIYDSYNATTHQIMCHSGTHDVNHAVVAVGLGTSVDKNGTATDCT